MTEKITFATGVSCKRIDIETPAAVETGLLFTFLERDAEGTETMRHIIIGGMHPSDLNSIQQNAKSGPPAKISIAASATH